MVKISEEIELTVKEYKIFNEIRQKSKLSIHDFINKIVINFINEI